MNSILVFRGGDGREYMNELHCLDLGKQHSPSVIEVFLSNTFLGFCFGRVECMGADRVFWCKATPTR